MSAASLPQSARWVHGPASDLLLGGGLIYVPLLALLILAGPMLHSLAPAGLMPLLVLAVGTPHVGATLLRVYEHREDRRAYTVFAVHITILTTVAFLAALYNVWLGSLLLSLYLTVLPWHFSGQNYGIALILMRRRGVDVNPDLKRKLYYCFLLPCILFVLTLHGGVQSSEYAPFYASGTVYRFLPLGIPAMVREPALILLTLAYIYALGSTLVQLRDARAWRDVAPGAVLLGTQALWYVLPVLVSMGVVAGLHPLRPENVAYTFVWVSVVHGAQYLWITTYYAERRQPGASRARYLLKALLAGSAIYGLPILVLSPALIGPLPFDSGLFVIVAAGLNLHHVLLDSAIWKLRDGRLARILIRGRTEPEEIVPRWSWLRPVIWASGAAGVLLTAAGTLEMEFGVRRAVARGDVARVERAAERLAWIGRDSAHVRSSLGYLMAQGGDTLGATAELERSVALLANLPAQLNLGALYERSGRFEQAERAYEVARTLAPEDARAWHWGGRAARKAGRSEAATALLEQAIFLAPDDGEIRRELALARAAARTGAEGALIEAGGS